MIFKESSQKMLPLSQSVTKKKLLGVKQQCFVPDEQSLPWPTVEVSNGVSNKTKKNTKITKNTTILGLLRKAPSFSKRLQPISAAPLL